MRKGAYIIGDRTGVVENLILANDGTSPRSTHQTGDTMTTKQTQQHSPEQVYWAWVHSEELSDPCVDAENVPVGPGYWERMLEAGKQAVADRKEERKLALRRIRSQK